MLLIGLNVVKHNAPLSLLTDVRHLVLGPTHLSLDDWYEDKPYSNIVQRQIVILHRNWRSSVMFVNCKTLQTYNFIRAQDAELNSADISERCRRIGTQGRRHFGKLVFEVQPSFNQIIHFTD